MKTIKKTKTKNTRCELSLLLHSKNLKLNYPYFDDPAYEVKINQNVLILKDLAGDVSLRNALPWILQLEFDLRINRCKKIYGIICSDSDGSFYGVQYDRSNKTIEFYPIETADKHEAVQIVKARYRHD